MSLRRQHPWMKANLSASLLFWSGVAMLPAYLMQQSLGIRVAQVALFALTARLAGKKILWMYFLSVTLAVTAFHLLTPSGRVLVTVASFRVTDGAILRGLLKGLTINGMVFLSLTTVRSDLMLPGRIGGLVARLFWSFEQIMERRGELSLRHAAATVDQTLVAVYSTLVATETEQARDAVSARAARSSSVAGRVVAGGVVVSQWALLVANLTM